MILDEQPSALQLGGVAVILGGILLATLKLPPPSSRGVTPG